jgi:hypothetical protein
MWSKEVQPEMGCDGKKGIKLAQIRIHLRTLNGVNFSDSTNRVLVK